MSVISQVSAVERHLVTSRYIYRRLILTIILYQRMHTAPSGHILMKSELKILARLLAAYSDEKLKEIKATIEEKEGGDVSLEEVERSIRERGLNSIADGLKDNLEKGKV